MAAIGTGDEAAIWCEAISAVVLYPVNAGGNVVMTCVGVNVPSFCCCHRGNASVESRHEFGHLGPSEGAPRSCVADHQLDDI